MNDPDALAEKVAAALRQIQPMAEAGWPQGHSMERQLLWCRNFLCGEPNGPLPGPFSMGLMATREFDMYGSEPELAALIYGIQQEMECRLGFANPPIPLPAPEMPVVRRIATVILWMIFGYPAGLALGALLILALTGGKPHPYPRMDHRNGHRAADRPAGPSGGHLVDPA